MRVMVCVPADKSSEAGVMPTQEGLTRWRKFNEELVKAGVMLDGDGLWPTSKAKRVRFSGAQRTVIDGPFAETKELIAGYWIWQVKSMEEAVEWLKRAPVRRRRRGRDSPYVRAPRTSATGLTPELREREERLRAEQARLNKRVSEQRATRAR